jgi:hypothetical protein
MHACLKCHNGLNRCVNATSFAPSPWRGNWVDPDVATDPRSQLLTTRQVLQHRSAWLHTGADDGARALVMLAPERDEGVVIFSNGDQGGDTFEPIVKACLHDGAAIIQRLKKG